MSGETICRPEAQFPRVGSAAQRRVDAIQQAIRAGAGDLLKVTPPCPSDPRQLHVRVSAELRDLQQLVDTLGDELTADLAVLTHHAGALQSLDLISQSLRSLADVLATDDLPDALARVGMSDLRARLSGLA